MAYSITPEDIASITDVELAFSTGRLLPKMEDIPADFLQGNRYTALASALFFGRSLPDAEIEMVEGFDPASLNRAVRAHLQSFSPSHEHKIAGVGYLISMAAVLR